MKGVTSHIISEQATRNLYIETYGCAMNLADSEVVASIMADKGFKTTQNMDDADVIFVNTCAIRDNAESHVWGRLKEMRPYKRKNPGMIIGVLGCMAERLKAQLLEKEQIIDIVVGPDAYRDIPQLIKQVEEGQKAVNVLLSREETYAEITPVRLSSNGVTAFISIMRGCDNMCSFCVVPFTRGRERSRDVKSIVNEAQELYNAGYKEVTLLGQNVDSYKELDENGNIQSNFAQLLEQVAQIATDLRVRFSSSHPKDITDEVLYTMKKYSNICNHIHFPIQSGNDRVLSLMNRTYDQEWLKKRLAKIREVLPNCALSTDTISGFCTETEEEHKDTLEFIKYARFHFAYMYFYSERPGTLAARRHADDVNLEDKKRRLQEIISAQQEISVGLNRSQEGEIHTVLVEGLSKRSDQDFRGRNEFNTIVIFPKENFERGDYVRVKIEKTTQTSLIGKAIEKVPHP
ncbi:MAG: tRNA (N6-isopentenyl adenosine(37)-C2)-methylthiotransferase MiaB [Bacteroidia bacterium]|nr:tRNA (N6-isopentenyl adenosine(37)-C2)-methylthiotransferase MiaB [Bacteroidia bacterium]MCF8427656.1 tRNA (N6-isopentenyl adenosine(37)-C2)-methylthiotransferase MiaB [Bacteroidia bacterium]MCF8446912.1 tRNA (N6-isopentenyl adenosine(37)-C2)-methylthiotransferase MiaB [Bacteroidia bacterium]